MALEMIVPLLALLDAPFQVDELLVIELLQMLITDLVELVVGELLAGRLADAVALQITCGCDFHVTPSCVVLACGITGSGSFVCRTPRNSCCPGTRYR